MRGVVDAFEDQVHEFGYVVLPRACSGALDARGEVLGRAPGEGGA